VTPEAAALFTDGRKLTSEVKEVSNMFYVQSVNQSAIFHSAVKGDSE
jgi:hypothetical protein